MFDGLPVLPKDGEYDWALGCPNCRYGIVGQGRPDYTWMPHTPFPVMRAWMVQRGELQVCDCAAGQAVRSYNEKYFGHLRQGAEVITEAEASIIQGRYGK